MTARGWMAGIPIWVRVPVIITLVLVGVVVSAMLLNTADNRGGHGSGDRTEMDSGSHEPADSGGHGRSGDETQPSDHHEGQDG